MRCVIGQVRGTENIFEDVAAERFRFSKFGAGLRQLIEVQIGSFGFVNQSPSIDEVRANGIVVFHLHGMLKEFTIIW